MIPGLSNPWKPDDPAHLYISKVRNFWPPFFQGLEKGDSDFPLDQRERGFAHAKQRSGPSLETFLPTLGKLDTSSMDSSSKLLGMKNDPILLALRTEFFRQNHGRQNHFWRAVFQGSEFSRAIFPSLGNNFSKHGKPRQNETNSL